jgi:magnesium transporter
MSGNVDQEPVARSAVPVADLSVVDSALSGPDEGLREAVRKVRPADLGRDLSRRTIAEGRRLLEACSDRRAGAMLAAANPSVAAAILASADPGRAARALGFLPTEKRTAILLQCADKRAAIEEALPPGDRAFVERVLGYSEAAVGRLMTPKIWRAERTATAAQAMEILKAGADQIEVAQNCYVTAAGHLVGVAPLREIAIAAPETPLEQLMTPDPIVVSEDTERGDAAEIISTHNFLSLPVMDKDGHLVGAVRVDDLLEAALAKVGTGFLNQGGVAGKIAAQIPYFQTSMVRVVRSRLTWLVLLFVAETATGTVLRHFEDELAKVVALSFFIPLLIGTGGNAGSQTVSTVIRALALHEVRLRDVWRVLLKEVSSGALLGFLLGIIAFGRALMWGVDYHLAMCVALTVLLVCTWANTVGSLIPLGAEKLGIDPTVVSAPLITTLVDASGLFLYLTVAHLLLPQLAG